MEQQAQAQNPFKQPTSINRLVICGLSAVMFSLTLVFSFLAAIPLMFGILLYGRTLGYINGLVFGFVCVVIAAFYGGGAMLVGSYAFAFLIAALCAEASLRNVNPIKFIFFGGVGLFFLSSISTIGYLKHQNTSLKEVTVQFIETNAQAFKKNVFNTSKAGNVEESMKSLSMLENPEKTADKIIKELPGYIILTNFVLLWLLTFLALKFIRVKIGVEKDRYTDKDLLKFKMPDYYIWIVIIGLALLIWGSELGEWHSSLGHFIIQSLGAFYFFQGFGLYIEFLNFVNFYGFLRIVLVCVTVFTAGSLIAIIGLFDMFVDFRKYLKKKEI